MSLGRNWLGDWKTILLSYYIVYHVHVLSIHTFVRQKAELFFTEMEKHKRDIVMYKEQIPVVYQEQITEQCK